MSKNLKDTIDRMVEDSIRRILPNVLNEVLVRTIANSGVIREDFDRHTPSPPVARMAPQQPRRKAPTGRLAHLLDPGAGADFYDQASPEPEPIYEQRQAPRHAQRLSDLPPMLQEMARDVVMEDMGDENGSWDDDSGAVPSIGPGDDAGPLEIAGRRAGLDFSHMARVAITESKKVAPKKSREDVQFEEQRIKRMRERLNGGKPIE